MHALLRSKMLWLLHKPRYQPSRGKHFDSHSTSFVTNFAASDCRESTDGSAARASSQSLICWMFQHSSCQISPLHLLGKKIRLDALAPGFLFAFLMPLLAALVFLHHRRHRRHYNNNGCCDGVVKSRSREGLLIETKV